MNDDNEPTEEELDAWIERSYETPSVHVTSTELILEKLRFDKSPLNWSKGLEEEID